MEEKAKTGESIRNLSLFPRIVFMGTPDFAVPSLQNLAVAGVPVDLVVTQPDRPQGRGRRVAPPPVKILAQKLGIPVYQPERVQTPEAFEPIISSQPECLVVVAYGQLLPQKLLDQPRLGALNVHASLLPRYRGAAPIQRALLAGEPTTGISIMLLDAGMDTGPILLQRELAVADDETFGTLHDKLARLGADLLIEALPAWKDGQLTARPQDDSQATQAPPIRKEELRISWDQSGKEIVNRIRAFDSWPGAYCLLGSKRLKCFAATLLHWQGEGRPGEIVGTATSGLVVLGGDRQAVAIGALHLDGHRRVAAVEFVRGHRLEQGTCLE